MIRTTLLLPIALACLTTAQAQSLESGWTFTPDPTGRLSIGELAGVTNWRPATVGLSWQAQFENLRDYQGAGWYRTQLDLDDQPGSRDSSHIILRFGAVDYFAEVYVNKQLAGTHEGGYTPFAVEVTSLVRKGRNELAVRVVDPPESNNAQFPQYDYKEIPHGKQNWYVQTSGIWQGVELRRHPSKYIENLRITPSMEGRVTIQIELAGDGTNNETLRLEIKDPKGSPVVLSPKLDSAVGQKLTFTVNITSPRLWSLSQPDLYILTASLGSDSVQERFGFRSFEAREGKLYFNGKPFYVIAALDQDFYPEGIYTPPSEAYVRDQFLKAKKLGLNTLRCHIKVPDPRYLKVADEVGLLVWYEIPNWDRWTLQAAKRAEDTLTAMIERDWNHPCVVIMSLVNESWGLNQKEATQREWLRALFDRAKRETAPLGRLIVDNSPCCQNFHVKTDINDYHQYYSIPDNYRAFDRWVADLATRPKWTFSPYGDAQASGTEPLMVSEFGNWGLPRLPDSLPWWFQRSFGGNEVTRPAGVLDRFKRYGFETLFRDFNDLAEATQWHQLRSLKHEIEEMRLHPEIQGYCVTEFTDLNWECNGLLDMWRNFKVHAGDLAESQRPDIIIARPNKYNYEAGEPVRIQLAISHYGESDLSEAVVEWSVAGSRIRGKEPVGAVEPAGVKRLRELSFVAPDVKSPAPLRVRMTLRSGPRSKPTRLAAGSSWVYVYPKPAKSRYLPVAVHDPGGSLRDLTEALKANGAKLKTLTERGALIIAQRLDAEVEQQLALGGKVLLLAASKDSVPDDSSLKIVPRAGSNLDGNWVTNFNWARVDRPPFSSVGLSKIIGFEAAEAIPRFVIRGVPEENFNSDVLSGVFYGWLNNNAGYAVQARAGKGLILVTTFRFDSYGKDPYATRLLDAMIEYLGGADFSPGLDLLRRQ